VNEPAAAPPELEARFAAYLALLAKWQKAVNLVSAATLPEARMRHIEDSLQLAPHIPAQTKTLADLGSGAGFPGLVLAMARPELAVHLIESDQKKGSFLATVSRETHTPVTLHRARLEKVVADPAVPVPDVVTARAFAALADILAYCLPWAERNLALVFLLPKGVQAESEIDAAAAQFTFTCDRFPSRTDPKAQLLKIAALRRKV
jgi:16S rRNA (guanine527-N7)-methyltransferase